MKRSAGFTMRAALIILMGTGLSAWSEDARQMTLDTGLPHKADGVQEMGEKSAPEVITMQESSKGYHITPEKRMNRKKLKTIHSGRSTSLFSHESTSAQWNAYQRQRQNHIREERNRVLQSIVIPRITFRQMRVEDAIRELERVSKEFDLNEEETHKGFEMVLEISPSKANIQVTFSAGQITVGDALNTIASVAGLRIDTLGRTVRVTDE